MSVSPPPTVRSVLGWFNVQDYGAKGDGTTDDTAAIQAAIDAAVAAGGGRVYFPAAPVDYKIAGSLRTDRGGYAQIAFPQVSTSNNKVVIELVGPYEGCADATWFQTVAPAGGAVLRSTLTSQAYSATFGSPSVLGGPTVERIGAGTYQNYSNLFVRLENIGVRTPANPSLGAIDLSAIQCAAVRRCRIDTSDAGAPSAVCTHVNAFGLRMPAISNNAETYIDESLVTGYYAGLSLTEHLSGSNLTLFKNAIGLFTYSLGAGPGHAAWFGLIKCEWCNYTIAGWAPDTGVVDAHGAPTAFSIACLSLENGTAPWNTVAHIKDASNNLVGMIHYEMSPAGSGIAAGSLTVTGAIKMRRVDLVASQAAAVVTTPVAGLLATDGSATNAQLSSTINQLIIAAKNAGVTL